MSRGSPRPSSSAPPDDDRRRRGARPFALFQVVALRRAHPERGLTEGQQGTIVEIVERPERAYVVDFTGGTDDDLRVATLTAGQLRPVPPGR
jgi:Domain of unknown function (DUF4926)